MIIEIQRNGDWVTITYSGLAPIKIIHVDLIDQLIDSLGFIKHGIVNTNIVVESDHKNPYKDR